MKLAEMQNVGAKYKYHSGSYLQNIQAGTEVVTGSNAKLDTTAYSIHVKWRQRPLRIKLRMLFFMARFSCCTLMPEKD